MNKKFYVSYAEYAGKLYSQIRVYRYIHEFVHARSKSEVIKNMFGSGKIIMCIEEVK